MFLRLFLALIALVGVMWFMAWYQKSAPNARNGAIKKGLIYFVAIALLLLVVTGRIPIIFAALSALIPFLHRLMAYRGLIGLVGRFAGKRFGQTTLTTAFLVVEYNLAKRSLDALITQGQFADKKLSQLNDQELVSLLEEVRSDFQSKAAVNAFILARQGKTGASWQQDSGKNNAQSHITIAQAHEILGLESSTTPKDVKKAHQQLINKLHPDRGGSSYLAAQINAAKDILLKHYT